MATPSSSNKGTVGIIGAGIVGINCALALQNRGFDVTLIDREKPGEGCSKGNAGHFATEQVFPLAEFSVLWQLPKMMIDPLGPVAISPAYFPKAIPWFLRFIANMFASNRTKNTKALRGLNELAIDAYRPILAQANAEYLFVEQGSLLVFESTPVEQVKAHMAVYQSEGVSTKLLNRKELIALEPNLADGIQYGIFFDEVAHTVNPLELSQKLAEHAQNIGVKVVQQEVTGIEHFDNKVTVSTDQGVTSFDQIIVATGAWSEGLLNTLGYKLPIEGERGYSLDMPEHTANQLTRPVASAERRFIITPMKQGLRLAGTVEFAGLKRKANMKRAEMLYKNAQHIVKDMPNRDEVKNEGWLGFRPSLPDSLPVIGRAPQHNNIVFALGHQHLGLTLGAITGKIVGQIFDNEQTDVDVRLFCISRFN